MKTARLADVALINPRGDKPPDSTTVSFVPMADLDSTTARTAAGEARPFREVSKGFTIFRDRDLLVAKITPCFENNKIGQAHLSHPVGVGSTEFHVVRPDPLQAEARYLLHYLRQDRIRAQGEKRMTGSAGQRRVPAAFLSELKVPLPPIEEQRRIAAILDHADGLRAKRRECLDQIDALTQSIFVDMFGDPLSNPYGLPRCRVGDVARVVTGNTPARAVASNYGTEVEWIKSDNLGALVATPAEERLSSFGRRRARLAPPGSVLVTCIAGSPASIGKASIVDREVAFNQQINAVLPSPTLRSRFLLEQFKVSPELVRGMSTGGMKGLVSKSSFQAIEIVVPPSEDQEDFEARAAAVDTMRSVAMDSARELEELKHSLAAEAFGGLA